MGEIFPSKRDNIEKLKNSFIRYALVKPWPLGNDEEPEFFEIKLWAREYADFNYYIGLGVGLKAGAEIARLSTFWLLMSERIRPEMT